MSIKGTHQLATKKCSLHVTAKRIADENPMRKISGSSGLGQPASPAPISLSIDAKWDKTARSGVVGSGQCILFNMAHASFCSRYASTGLPSTDISRLSNIPNRKAIEQRHTAQQFLLLTLPIYIHSNAKADLRFDHLLPRLAVPRSELDRLWMQWP